MITQLNMYRLLPALLVGALLAGLAVACAPTARDATGVDAGDIAPPFAMQLTDGSQVSLKNLVDDEQPTLLMYFATW